MTGGPLAEGASGLDLPVPGVGDRLLERLGAPEVLLRLDDGGPHGLDRRGRLAETPGLVGSRRLQDLGSVVALPRLGDLPADRGAFLLGTCRALAEGPDRGLRD